MMGTDFAKIRTPGIIFAQGKRMQGGAKGYTSMFGGKPREKSLKVSMYTTRTKTKTTTRLKNLACVPGKVHISFHSNERVVNDYDRILKNIHEKVVPAARAWHKSEAGRDWHRIHAKKTGFNIVKKDFVCQYCGAAFTTQDHGNNRFCSNKCRAAARRASGVDDVEKVCSRCGKTYIANKYQKTKYCKQCRLR